MINCLQILSTGQPFQPNVWYEVQLNGLGEGSEGFNIVVNDTEMTHTSPDFTGVNFDSYTGPLYIGGHPNLALIEVNICYCHNNNNTNFIKIVES